MRLIVLHILLTGLLSANAATYFVDAVLGSDANPGTTDMPWQTLSKVQSAGLLAGDEVVLRDGYYGDWQVGINRVSLFPGWVTIRAEAGHSPAIGTFMAGADGLTYFGSDRSGTYNLFLILDGVDITDGFKLYGARNAIIRNGLIRRDNYTGGSIEAPAAEIKWGSDITLENLEITKTGIGISARGYRITIDGCNVYDVNHDSMRSFGLMESVIRNTRFVGADDGFNDKDPANTTQPDRHSDLLHFLYPGSKDLPPEFYNNNILVENCTFAFSEGAGVQFNNDRYSWDDSIANKNITFRNCVFGPTRANAFNAADAVENVTVVHCTFIRSLGGMTYTNPNSLSGRTINCNNSTLRISSGINIRVYNNILTGPTSRGFGNLINAPVSSSPLPRWSEYFDGDLFVDAFSLTGILTNDVPALGFGIDPSIWPWGWEVITNDAIGTVRGTRPEAGAWELPGFNPAAVPTPPQYTNQVAIFVDDFEDAMPTEDPWLRTPTEQGIGWTHWSSQRMTHGRSTASRRNYFADTTTTWTVFAVAGNAPVSRDISARYFAKNNYQSNGGGLVFMAQNLTNYYWMEIAGGAARLKRSMVRDGTNQVVTLYNYPSTVRLGNSGSKTYEVRASWSTNGILVRLDDSGFGLFEHPDVLDTDALAITTFESGGQVGFRRSYTANQNHNIEYDNVRIELFDIDTPPPPPVDPPPPDIDPPLPGGRTVTARRVQVGSIILQTP
jgi:hypothetical protein